MDSIIILTIGVVAGTVIIWLVLRFQKKDTKEIDNLGMRLDGLSNSVNIALRDTMKLVTEQLKDTRESQERATGNVHKQVQSFTQGLTKLNENMQSVHNSVKDVSSFQEMFRSPKLRGIWGEASLESALEQFFSKDNYLLQYYFKSGEAVDAIIKLPNELLLPIDSKFNWENFGRLVNTTDEIEKDKYRKQFSIDIKKQIDDIASKYILPSEGTTDLALMFIPAETVYYEIISNIKNDDIPKYGEKKRVWLVSPNTLGLSIAAIRHWLKDIQFSKQTKEIIKKLDTIGKDGNKLADTFRKLGKHISDTKSAYDDSEKRLTLMVDRVERIVETEGKDDEKNDQLET